MITDYSFSEDWIKYLKKQNDEAIINPPLAEKMNHALLLVELLAVNGLNFIFKGGTSLILLLDKPQRFSIDIDIITQANQAEIEIVLANICKDSRFSTFELDEKRSYQKGIPKAHYKFTFSPIFAQPRDNTILLDILFAENPYPKLQEIAIVKDWIDTKEPYKKVLIPTIESITGDKLTAFAPNTVGILYEHIPPKSTEIIKQMFDLGQLFDKITDFEVVTKAFYQNVEKELMYREELVGKTVEDVIEDILATCFEVVKETQKELQNGIKAFGSWTIYPFRKEQAFETAGKIAYIIAKIKMKNNLPLLKFDVNSMKIIDFLIEETDYNFLNKKVKFAHNALFYWYQTIKILKNT